MIHCPIVLYTGDEGHDFGRERCCKAAVFLVHSSAFCCIPCIYLCSGVGQMVWHDCWVVLLLTGDEVPDSGRECCCIVVRVVHSFLVLCTLCIYLCPPGVGQMVRYSGGLVSLYTGDVVLDFGRGHHCTAAPLCTVVVGCIQCIVECGRMILRMNTEGADPDWCTMFCYAFLHLVVVFVCSALFAVDIFTASSLQ